ncbi:MAG: penicillin-binding protein [Desulfuromonas sp.]|nr:MAG: penicillin-binding protein [Desulfuromonas sp.]
MERREKWLFGSIRLVAGVFVMAFVLMAGRAFQLQVVQGDAFKERAERQHQRVVPLSPQRGTIYDRNGEAMAVSIEVDSIYVNPRKVDDAPGTAKALAVALDLPLDKIRSKLNSRNSFQWLKRRVTPREGDAVRELALPGVQTVKEHRRFYPNSGIGAQMVGFTGLDPEGLEGLELEYDTLLLGQGGFLVTGRDALGRGMGAGDDNVREGVKGNSLHLTLDRNLQYLVEKELAAGVKAANARAGMAVLIEPHSGQVLAMASQPDYNPNAISEYRPSQWRNRAICDTYEPGSTFKLFLMAAALEEGVVKPQDKIYCENGRFRVGGRYIHDHKKYGQLSVEEVLKYSSNIGVAKISKKLERERFYSYIRDFGFGDTLGVDLPGEVGGTVHPPSRWFEVDLAAISFGQGVTVTTLQMANAVASIANGGYLMQPYVVDKVLASDGRIVAQHRPQLLRQVISEETSDTLREMMANVVDEGGTGTRGRVPGFRVGGKTGTAQKVDPVTGGYSVDKRVASFVGFVPVDDPKLVLAVTIDEPQGVQYGGVVAAPVFSRIAAQALIDMNVAPTEPVVHEAAVPAQRHDEAVAYASAGADTERGASGKQMPRFVGLSYRQSLRAMETNGLNVKLTGTGTAVAQYPPPGAPVAYGDAVWVRFSPRL